ncbi:MAG: hypothetical protein LBD14_00485 [Puniceicoccales bacterium]|jgi:hypothetical protein|nr:hypothetical protein [Puniceicoccales bacterium]
MAAKHPSRPQPPGIPLAPNALAQARLAGKRLTPTPLDSETLAALPLAAREAGFFSAKVDSLERLAAMKARIEDALAMPPDKAFADRAAFVADMRIAMGAEEGDTGALTDIDSARRLGLIYDFQIEDAYSHARWQAGQTPDILDAFPCQELIRVEQRDNPRDWAPRWLAAGGKLSKSRRMIARKDSPVWTALSAFGRPWPPFDYGSGMGVRDVDREEAIAEGVITKDTIVQPDQKHFQRTLEKSIKKLPPEMRELLREDFGGAVRIDEDTGKIHFFGSRPDELLADRDAEKKAAARAPLPTLPDPAKANTAIQAGDAEPVSNPKLGEIPTLFAPHLNQGGPYSREYRKQYLPAARAALKDGNHFPGESRDGQEAAPEIFHKIFRKDGAEYGIKVLVEKAGDWKARLKGEIADLRATAAKMENVRKGATGPAAELRARAAKLEAELQEIERTKPYGRAWNYYDVPADRLREEFQAWRHRNDTPPKRKGGKD